MSKTTNMNTFSVRLCCAVTLLLSLFGAAFSHAQEGSDIYIGKLNFWHKQPITELTQVTDNNRYSNQPYFFDSQHLYFTQAEISETPTANTTELAQQMDIFVYQLSEQSMKNVTNSSESEYSPTPVPNSQDMSVIRVNAENKQELWTIDTSGQLKTHLVPAIEPVGYQVWLNAEELLLFVLGEPHSLQRVNIKTPNAQGEVVDTHIGASLFQFEQSDWFLYSKNTDTNMLKAYNAAQGTSQDVTELPAGSVYFSVGATGHVMTSDGNTLYHRQIIKKGKRLQAQGTWTPIKIEGEACQNGISRTAISHFGDKVALVCARN